MSKILTSSDRFLMSGGRWLTREEPEPPPPPPVTRYVYLNQTTGGTISASPMSGVDGDTVTLSNSPDTNYTFDGYTVNGATLYDGNKFDFDGSDVTCSASWNYVPPQPVLPPFTIRFKYKEGRTPSFSGGTVTKVSSSPDIWDHTYNYTNWEHMFAFDPYLIEVIAANSTGVTSMDSMFENSWVSSIALFDTSTVTDMDSMFESCKYLTTVPEFDTRNVTSMSDMFKNCTALKTVPLLNTSKVTSMTEMFDTCSSLTSIPLFNTSKCTSMQYMFNECRKVKHGSLALYRQASTQANPVSYHFYAFHNCGADTTTGAAELAQISKYWKD